MNNPFQVGLQHKDGLIRQEFSLAHFYIDNPLVVLRVQSTVFLNQKQHPQLLINTHTSVKASVNGKRPSDLSYCFSIRDPFGLVKREQFNSFVEDTVVIYQIELCMHYMEHGLLSATEIRQFEQWEQKHPLKPENHDCYHYGYLNILYWQALKVGEQIRNRLTCLTECKG